MKVAAQSIFSEAEPILLVDDFLDRSACRAALNELRFAFWKPSTVATTTRHGEVRSYASSTRISESTSERSFTHQLSELIQAIDTRLTCWVPQLVDHREEWQATRYAKGGRFDYHLDAGLWRHEPSGDRTHTILLYLDTPTRGGGTRFCELNTHFQARAGRLLIWSNLTRHGKPNHKMLHSSVPLVAGRKTVLVTWVRQREAQEMRQI